MKTSNESPPPGATRTPQPFGRIFLICLAGLSPAIFAISTGNIWEDFFITFRCSLNLVNGEGLVYEAGRRVHVFTSPIGTLLPAGISWLLRTDDPLAVVDCFRLVGCAAMACAWALGAGRLQGSVAMGVAAGLWLLDAKLAAFSTNGMESGLLVLFVVLAWRALIDGRMTLAGVALGGAMWTRPDGFVFVGAIAMGALIFPAGKRPGWNGWLRMTAIASALYAPWFFFAWWYYGSPVPQTVTAKSVHLLEGWNLRAVLLYPFRFLFGRSAAHDAFLPPYFFFGGWPEPLYLYGKLLALLSVVPIFWNRCSRPARVAATAFIIGGGYLTFTTRSPWYYPGWQVLAFIAIAGLAAAFADSLRRWPAVRVAAMAVFAAIVLVQAWQYVAVSNQLRAQQRVVEWGVRRQIGLDLRRFESDPKSTVFLEPLGYVGFFSGLGMRDAPGLSSPEVAALRRTGVVTMGDLIAVLRPDWTVLRAAEYNGLRQEEIAALDRDYELWAIYDARQEIQAIPWLPGRNFLEYDAYYAVWHRRPVRNSR